MNDYIQMLHDYNDLKDVGQTLLGKLAEMEGATIREMYNTYGLNTDD
jgi:hypothetical protein